MSNLKSYIRNTLSVHLTLWVVAIAILLFVAVLWIMLWFARQTIKEEATEKARAALETAELTIYNELSKVETAVRNMQYVIEQHLDNPDDMKGLSHQMLESNPFLQGCIIAFRHDYYSQKGRNFMVYNYRVGDKIIGRDDYYDTNYSEESWFANTVRTDSAEWADPSEVSRHIHRSITSYSIPLHKDSIVGVLSVDISLDQLSHVIQENRPLPSAYCSLLSQSGSFIVHRDTVMLTPGSLKEQVKKSQSDNAQLLAEAMMRGESGSLVLQFYGMDFYIIFRPFKDTKWSLNIVCPEHEIFGSYHYLLQKAIQLTVIGILALVVFCCFYIGWELRPLVKLDSSTRQLTAGNFDHLLEKTKRGDEIGHMQRVFRNMQLSLTDYLNKIKRQRKSLDKQGNALRQAYEHTKEAENAKNTFIHSATDQLTHPVVIISDLVGRIHQEHTRLSQEEIKQMTDTIGKQSKAVTDLLDSMIKVSMNSITSAS